MRVSYDQASSELRAPEYFMLGIRTMFRCTLGTAVNPGETLHEATGRVESLTEQEMVISHGAARALEWPAKTMSFELLHPDLAHGLKPGDRVKFQFRPTQAGFAIERLEKLCCTAARGCR